MKAYNKDKFVELSIYAAVTGQRGNVTVTIA